MSTLTTLVSSVDRKVLSAIVDAARTVLQSAGAFLDAVRFGKGTPETNVIYEEWDDDLAALRRCIADAGCFNLRRQFFKSREDTRAYACLRTIAKDVGEHLQAPHTAGALPPLPTEESVAHLAAFVAAVEKLQGSSTLNETAKESRTKRGETNGRMLAKIQADSEAIYWSINQWVDYLGRSKSTVAETKTWQKVCLPARERERLARGKRRRGPGERRKKPN